MSDEENVEDETQRVLDRALGLGCAVIVLFMALSCLFGAPRSTTDRINACAAACGPGRMSSYDGIECRCVDVPLPGASGPGSL